MSSVGITTILGTILFHSLSLVYLSIPFYAYSPVDIFNIDCGSSGNSSSGDQTWVGDNNSILLVRTGSRDKESVEAKAVNRPSLTTNFLYSTARLSYSEFSYSFPVTAGQKFVRLYFYPDSYPGFGRSKSFFSVQCNNFTLLKDFNASLTVDASRNVLNDTITLEYCLNVEAGQRLNLTFTPSTTHPDFYAFINGIEVVSMPANLYYTKTRFRIVGTENLYPIEDNKHALQNEYRLNVGGSSLSPDQDTGMFRSWDSDDAYVVDIELSYLPADFGPELVLSYSKIPDYTAPAVVYRTARSMGMNLTINRSRNITWEFLVDSGFTYLLRLHFCEFSEKITEPGQRRFFIYIAEQLAEDNFDVLTWSEKIRVPIYKDYAVFISGDQKKTSLSLKMHPYPGSTYEDAFLSGLEIFKVSNYQNSLGGPNPDPLPQHPPQANTSLRSSEKKSSSAMIGGVAGAVSGVVLLSIILTFFLVRRSKKVKHSKSATGGTSTKSRGGSSSLPSDICRHFSIGEIRAATNNFDELFIVGVGGFGNVYKGYIDGNTVPVAIKRLKPGSQQGAHEFQTEIEMLSQLRHLHLVSLIGYCNESNEMILVYDFMDRGTLRDHLYNSDMPALSWKQRLQICVGAAKGLHYLHTGAKHTIIHRDVKSTNILLDEKWTAKVSDFGLSKFGPTNTSKTYVTTVVKGSLGYLDPEYYKRQRLTEKSDVYSFGVLLFEILCARPPLIRMVEKEQMSLADWATRNCHMGTLVQIVDPNLQGQIAPECLKKFGEIGVSCLVDNGSERPSMSDVVGELEFALQLQENAEQRGTDKFSEDMIRIDKYEDSDDMFTSGTSIKSSGVSMTSSGDHSYGSKETDRLMMSANVFSEIMDPKAR